MQKYKVSFKGQNIYVGIDVHLKTWHVTTLTESGCKYSFSQHADAKELFDRRNGVRHLCAHGHTQTLVPTATFEVRAVFSFRRSKQRRQSGCR